MNDMMTFPDTWEEFEKSYGFTDNEEVYTNGARLIPSFRVKQWLDHKSKQQTKRQATISSDRIGKWIVYESSDGLVRRCTCDQCGFTTHGKQWVNPHYCQNCGAKMTSGHKE